MGKLDIIVGMLGALNKLAAAKADDGKVDAGEVVEIVLSVAGAALGVDGGKLTAWIKATEDLIGDGVLSKRIGLLKD
ncbi:MAG: hypothetical protein V1793_19080 [Pseudomonadota bacterium]